MFGDWGRRREPKKWEKRGTDLRKSPWEKKISKRRMERERARERFKRVLDR